MKTRRLTILLLAGVLAAAVLTAFSTAASAQSETVAVQLPSGEIVNVTVDVPPGGSLDDIKLPGTIVKRDSTSRWAFPPDSTIEITAKGRRTGESYGAATCVLNRKGELVAMHIHEERTRYADGGALKQEPRG